MIQSVNEINLDEVEASIKRCEEFLAANEIDFSFKPTARASQELPVSRKSEQDSSYAETNQPPSAVYNEQAYAANLRPSDDDVERVIRDSMELEQTVQRSHSVSKRQSNEDFAKSIEEIAIARSANKSVKEERRNTDSLNKPADLQASATEKKSLLETEELLRKEQIATDLPQDLNGEREGHGVKQPVRPAQEKIAEHKKDREAVSSVKASRLSDSYKTLSASEFAVHTQQIAEKDDTIKEFRLTAFEEGPMISTEREEMIYERKEQKPVKNYKTQEKIEEIRKDLEEKEMRECTFQPEINSSGYRATVNETADRLYEESEMLEEQREIEYYEKERELAQKCSFQPQINNKSRELAKKQASSLKVEDRMLAANEEMRMRMNLREEQKEYEEVKGNQPYMTEEYKRKRDLLADKRRIRAESMYESKPSIAEEMIYDEEIECTHHPRINQKSEQLVSKYPSDFEERNRVWEERKLQKIEELREEEENKVTGTPNLNATALGPQTGLEEAHERLYLDAEIREELKSSSTRAGDLLIEDEECTFSPKLQAESMKLVENKSYNLEEDAIAMYSEKLERERELQILKEEQEANHSFKPKVSEFAKEVSSHYDFKNPDVLMAEIEDEEEEREIILHTKQVEQLQRTQDIHMQEKPTISHIDKRIYQPEEVKGLDMFMSKVQRERELEEEKRQREAKVFGYGQNWENKETVAEEFSLSTIEKKKCDFVEVPAYEKTTDQKMRDLVGAILRSEI